MLKTACLCWARTNHESGGVAEQGLFSKIFWTILFRLRGEDRAGPPSSAMLEALDLAFVLLGARARVERAEVAALAGVRVLLARIEPVFAI